MGFQSGKLQQLLKELEWSVKATKDRKKIDEFYRTRKSIMDDIMKDNPALRIQEETLMQELDNKVSSSVLDILK